MKKIVVVLLLVLALLVSCAAPDPGESSPSVGDNCIYIAAPYHYLWRCVDKEAGVVCWVAGDALSCILLDETDLDGSRE